MENKFNMEILASRDNKLIERKEYMVKIVHWPHGTPSRRALREQIAQMLGVSPDLVYVRKLKTEYGKCESLARVHVYNSVERARSFEPAYIIRRNLSEGEKKEGGRSG